jgi:peptide/nickel transport system substrate-binding protein
MSQSREIWLRPVALLMLFVLLLSALAACGGQQPAPEAEPETAETPEEEAAPEEGAEEEAAPEEGAEEEAAPEEGAEEEAAPEESAEEAAPEEGAEEEAAPEEGAAEESGSFLVFGNSGEPDSLDSMNTTTGTSLIVTRQIEETLVGFVPGSLDLQPALATSWEANEDSTVWTFELREGVDFHDGTPFNAEAVVFNFERMADPEFEFGFRDEGNTFAIFPQIFGGYVGEEGSVWGGVEAVDEYTVEFTLTQPTPLFADWIAASYFGISSPAAIQEHGVEYGTPAVGGVGTGPFQFLEWQPGQSLTLERYDNYWGETARMPGLVVRFIDDAAQRLAELEAGAVDYTLNLTPDARETIANNDDLEVTPVEPFTIAYLSMNLNNPPLDIPEVRQAIAHAIDREAILDGLYSGVGTPAYTFLPDVLAWARPDEADLNLYEYDPERAQELLAEAGFPDGFDTMTLPDGSEAPLELWYMPVSRPYYPAPQPVAEAYAAYLAAVGIDVELQTEDWGVYLDNWDAGTKYGLVMLGWTGDYADPNNFLFTHFGPGVVQQSGYENQEVFDLLSAAPAAPTQEEAAELFQQANVLINQDLPRMPVVHAPPVYAQKADMEGWIPSPTGSGDEFATIFIEK